MYNNVNRNNNNMYYRPRPIPLKPSQKDFLGKLPFWCVMLFSSLCIAFGSWYGTYSTTAIYLNMFEGIFSEISFNGFFAIMTIFNAGLSLLINYLLATFCYSIFLRASRSAIKMPKHSFIALFLMINNVILLIFGSVSFVFLKNPMQYMFVSNIAPSILLGVGAFALFFYIVFAYDLNDFEKTLIIKGAIIPYLLITLIGNMLLGVIV